MQHIDFIGRNKLLLPPVGTRDVAALHVKEYDHPTHGKMVMSVWELTEEERTVLLTGGVVTLHVMGQTHPPVALGVSVVDKTDAKPI